MSNTFRGHDLHSLKLTLRYQQFLQFLASWNVSFNVWKTEIRLWWFSSVFLLWVKWLFWLRRWKEVLHVYIHKLDLVLIPDQIVIYNSLSIILGIILHDVLQKTIKIFYFSRFKPSSLQFTTTQLLRRGFQWIYHPCFKQIIWNLFKCKHGYSFRTMVALTGSKTQTSNLGHNLYERTRW